MSRTLGSKEFWLAGLRADGAAFQAAVTEAPLDTPVPSCPGWTLADLTGHLGAVYGRIAAVAGRGVTTPPDTTTADYLPPAGTNLLPWFDGRLRDLLHALDDLDPEQPAWNWAPQAKKAGFWVRRAAHETAVHRWDAQFALLEAEPIEAKLAADGVSEVLDTILPAGKGQGPRNVAGIVGLVATDAAHEWYVRLRGPGLVALLDTGTLLDAVAPQERALARGTASDLLLALWGRVGPDVLEVTGDERLLAALTVG